MHVLVAGAHGQVGQHRCRSALVTALSMESTHVTFEILSGDEPIEAALKNPVNDQ